MEINKNPLMLLAGMVLSSLLCSCGGSGSSGGTTSTATAAASTTASTTGSGTTSTAPATTTTTVTTTPVVVTPPPAPPPPPPPPARYLKLDIGGNELPANATSWSCVKDKETGLIWEAKTDDGGLRDKDWRFRHAHNFGGYASNIDYNNNVLCQNVGSSSCDAYTYVNALNGSGLCGRNSWRLPLMEELLSLVQINANEQRPNIDLTYFPETANSPGKAAYCSENMSTYSTCGDGYSIPTGVDPNARAECNYQGVDYGLPVRAENPRGDSMVALRYYGEVQDGKGVPNTNWICYTRLVSSN